jgi:hypothetical protein
MLPFASLARVCCYLAFLAGVLADAHKRRKPSHIVLDAKADSRYSMLKFTKRTESMKKNLGTFSELPICVGAALLALCTISPLSHAAVVDNMPAAGYSTIGNVEVGNFEQAQVFTMPSYGGTISSLALRLQAPSSVTTDVDLYSVSGSTFSFVETFGTVTADSSGTVFAVSLSSNPSLSADTSYAIALQKAPSTLEWGYTTTSGSGGDGTLGSTYLSTDAGVTWIAGTSGQYLQMDLAVVPEVPVTGTLMGLGALIIAAVHALRCKPTRVP